jgi:SAM-dependent methyltransferase
MDLAAADGSLVCIPWPEEAAAVVAEVRRTLRRGGRFVARTFLRPDTPETLEIILDDLEAGRIGGPYVLKTRVGAALHTGGLAGMSMRNMWELWQELFPDQRGTAERFGWPFQSFTMLHDYQPDIRIVYPTLDELRALLAPHFREVDCVYGRYELSERCPTLVLEAI